MTEFEKHLEQYNYDFPPELIANHPTLPRDHARLLIYNRETRDIKHDKFLNLDKHISANSVIVFNNTKVTPSSLELSKASGSKVKCLFVEWSGNTAIIKANKKLAPDNELYHKKNKFKVIKKTETGYEIVAEDQHLQIGDYLENNGSAPLPPYMKDVKLSKAKAKELYQTVFAETPGSIAAPTASLHFTNRLINKLRTKGAFVEFVTLEVGLGTFAPLKEENLASKKLHKERYVIDPSTAARLQKYKNDGKTIIAVGTTVVRTLESAFKNPSSPKLSGDTDLFINQNYKLKFVDQLITNFHVPKSSLLMLVSAFTERTKLMEIYRTAITKKYKLFSFGDGMFIK